MGKFQFRKSVIELDIEGVIYEIPGGAEYFKKLEDCGTRMVTYSKDNKESDLQGLTDFMLGILEELLGEDAVDSIFAEREPEYYDCLALFEYITGEIKTYHQERLAAIKPVDAVSAPTISNRAARRAAKSHEEN